MYTEFYIGLFRKLLSSVNNNFDDNHDVLRFGKEEAVSAGVVAKLYEAPVISKRFINRSAYNGVMNRLDQALEIHKPYLDRMCEMYEMLEDDQSKQLLLDLISYRMLGKSKVKLPVNTKEYWSSLEMCQSLEDTNNRIPANFLDWKLGFFDLKPIGQNIKLHLTPKAILNTFVVQQYRYTSPGKMIEVNTGDTVIDAGGCWGDTALFFANKAGQSGRVYTYEFIPKNLSILRGNLSINPTLAPNVEIVERPLWESDGLPMYFIDRGPASSVYFDKPETYDGVTATHTIDMLVRENDVQKVDFIKMDIEGAEPHALKGAVETIKRDRPTLAIAIYHSMDDLVNIPLYLKSLGLGYKFYLGHYTIHHEETILFATIN